MSKNKDKNFNNRNLVYQSKDLPRFSYKLTLNEQKMLSAFFSRLNQEDDIFREETMDIEDIINICGFKDENPHRLVARLANSLGEAILRYYNGIKFSVIPWFHHIRYEGGTINFKINDAIQSELLHLYKNKTLYITMDPSLIPKFQNGYAFRLSLVFKGSLVSYEKTLEYPLEKFCEMLKLSSAYNPKKNINAASNQRLKILEPAIKEINNVTNMHIEYKAKKDGKRIVAWEFKISKQNTITVQTSETAQTKYWYEDDVEVENAIKGLTFYGVNKSSIIPLLSNFKDKQYFLDAKEYALEKLLTTKNIIENKAGWLYNAIKNYDISISETYATMAKESGLPTEIINAINTTHNWSDIIRLVKAKNEPNIAIAIFTYARKRKEYLLSKYKRRYRELSYYDENGHLITDADNIIAEYDVDTEVLKILKGGTEIIEDPINLE